VRGEELLYGGVLGEMYAILESETTATTLSYDSEGLPVSGVQVSCFW
jgi:hypothetical protein